MNEMPALPAALREKLPPEVQVYVGILEEQVVRQQAQISALQAQVEKLSAQLAQNSQNSSRPPSSDLPSVPPRPPVVPSGRKRGAQKGHPGHQRRLLDESELDAIETHWPTHCPHCATVLPQVALEEGEPARQQVWELPPIRPLVVEHRFPRVCCPQCQRTVQAERPATLPPGAFGARLTSLVGLLNGRYRLSKREVVSLLDAAFGVEISLGGVVRATQQLSAALAAPYAELGAAVAHSAAANVDETGWKQAGARRWLWVAVTTVATFFYLAARRARCELRQVLGTDYGGIVTSDRYSAYLGFAVAQRQLCWAHLKRDLVACSQAGGASGAWGKRALAVVAQLFALWHRFKQGEIDRASLQTQMQPHQADFRALLAEGRKLPAWSKAHGLCGDLLKLEPALWTFLTSQGIEPTNNAAERALRPAVLWRKSSFGSQSDSGLRFVERILSVSETCRQHQRPLLPFLSEAVAAYWAGLPHPSLLPSPHTP